MITLAKWLLPSLAVLILSSCAGDVMQIMKERNQPVGVLMVKPEPAAKNSVSAVGETAISVINDQPIDPRIDTTIGVYDGQAKTFRGFGKSIVANLRGQGINAQLLDSYPERSSVIDKNSFRPKYLRLPAEAKKYPLVLVVNERAAVGVFQDSQNVDMTSFISAAILDPTTMEVLGQSHLYPHGARHIPTDNRDTIHRTLDLITVGARQKLLDEVFYQYGE